ncbi:MAG: ShlB/FhaC/HecB family hemolysin secretion/activation protein [Cyanobacteria bacterium P01_B01_bin.77]
MNLPCYLRSLTKAYLLLIVGGQSAIAQVPSSLPSTVPDPVEQTLPGNESTPTFQAPVLQESTPILIPEDITPQEDAKPEISTSEETIFAIRQIEVLGSTVLQEEINGLVNTFFGIDPDTHPPAIEQEPRQTTLTELLNLRSQITNLYIEEGYITSGAFLPNNQTLPNGNVYIQVVEGTLEELQINGLHYLKDYYVRDRINLAIGSPLNVNKLEEGLQLLQIDPLIGSVNSELTAGSGPGKNILVLDLTEADPFFLNLAFNNSRSPSIGTVQGSPTLTHQNVFGFGDRLSARYDATEGLELYNVSYTVPFNAIDGTFSVSYDEGESRIVDDQFQDAGIRSETETLSFNLRQPLTRSLSSEIALGLGFDLRESRSFILENEPFSFSLGPEDGVSKVSVLRFSQEWLNRDIDTVLALRSQFNIGLDAFDATVNDTGTDGRFVSWIGQFQWVQQLSPSTLLLARLNAQLTPDSLLPLERFSLGGVSTVRGYAQNEVVTDNAITSSVEVRLPLSAKPNELMLTPFIDFGTGWNNRSPDPENATLLGIGTGIQWQPIPEFNLRLDYGIPLIFTDSDGSSLQEDGFYFSVNLQPF